MKNRYDRKVRAMLALTGIAVSASLAHAQDAAASETKEETVKLEKFEVIGSRIKRIDAEPPQPVLQFNYSDFQSTGFSTLGDAIRAVPAISGQSLVSVDAGTSFTPGVSSFNLRGLGANNTLVLINGRRAAPFASAGFNGFQTVFDLNSIPTAAIESLEILKDGASAIYGSDAVAGVINVTLRKDYSGLNTEFSIGNTFETDSFEKSAFLIYGSRNGKVGMVTTIDWQERNGIYGRDLPYTDESDGRRFGGLDQRSTSTPIAGVRGLNDRVTFPAGTATFNTPQTNPTLAAAVPGIPVWNFQEEAQLIPDTRSFGFYNRATFDFSDALTFFSEVSFRRSEVRVDSASTPVVSANEIGNSPTGTLQFPASNPFNPFGQNITDIRWRMTELGARIQDSTADTPRLIFGVEGTLPWDDWTWEAAVLYTKNTVSQLQRNYTADSLVQNAFNGVTLNGRLYYLNPFGPNPKELIDYLRITNPNEDEFEIRSMDFSVGGPIVSLATGDLSIAFGAETREEEFENTGTLLNRDGGLVGGGTGSDVYGSRSIDSFYAELSVPIAKNLWGVKKIELQLAGRYENYSDFGETTKPKAALVYQPIEEVLLRASYGESFLAPNLAFLYTAQSISFTSNTLPDPLRPSDPPVQIRQIGGGNPGLQPEETEVYYAGVVLEPFSRQRGSIFRELSFGVDHFRFKQENLIARLTAANVLANVGAFGGLIVRNPPAPGETVGTINSVLTTWQNLTVAEYEGLDFNVRWVFPETSIGQFRANVAVTHLLGLEGTNATGVLVDSDGNYSFPLNRGTASLAWKRDDWAAALYVTYIGGYSTRGTGLTTPDVGEQLLFNPQVAFSGWFDSTITLGVRNVFNKAPPVDPSDSKLVNENVNSVEPAFWYIRWGKDW